MGGGEGVMYSLLDTIHTLDDLRKLERAQLPQLADELRRFLIESVSKTGRHLSSNLGTVELTIALHYIYHTPDDRLVWDVGHQTYAHKILTGRREAMSRLGMAGAAQLENSGRRAVAIIGDGALTGGMAFEALNNAGAMDANLLVILNDNDMSISQPVGALNNYLARLMSGRFYAAMRRGSEKMFKGLPPVLEFAKRAEEHVKGMVTPSTLFEEFGFNYIGPVDGHDLDVLLDTLGNIRQLTGPQFLHVVTQKGRGYTHAEQDCVLYHGVSKFDPANGIAPAKDKAGEQPAKPTYAEVFGKWLCDMAEQDERLVGITPAMCEGSGMA